MIRKLPNLVSVLLLKIVTSQKILFLVSFALGALLAVAVRLHHNSPDQYDDTVPVPEYDWAYERWLAAAGLASVPRDPGAVSYHSWHGRQGRQSRLYRDIQKVSEIVISNI